MRRRLRQRKADTPRPSRNPTGNDPTDLVIGGDRKGRLPAARLNPSSTTAPSRYHSSNSGDTDDRGSHDGVVARLAEVALRCSQVRRRVIVYVALVYTDSTIRGSIVSRAWMLLAPSRRRSGGSRPTARLDRTLWIMSDLQRTSEPPHDAQAGAVT
jgi:hypothetical protein